MKENIEVKGFKYKKVYERGACGLYFNRQNTWDDGRYLLVDYQKKHVFIADAYNVWEESRREDGSIDLAVAAWYVWCEGSHVQDAERYLCDYGDLDMSITTLVKRLDKLEGKA